MASPFNETDPTSPGHYGPSKTALFLLDFHSLFVQKAGGPKALDALKVASSMRSWAKSRGIIVIHALIDTGKAPYSTCKGVERLEGVITAMRSNGTDEPLSLVDGFDGDKEITFMRTPGHVSALKSPGILDYLQKENIQSLILTGLSTSGCALRLAIPATDAEFVVTVISDACADPDQGVHDLLVGKVLPIRAYVTTAAEFQQGYGT